MAASTLAAVLITLGLAFAATGIGIALYRFGKSTVKHRGVRLSGAGAIAALSYVGMAYFFLELQDRRLSDRQSAELEKTLREFDYCTQQEKEFVCRQPAARLREVCAESFGAR